MENCQVVCFVVSGGTTSSRHCQDFKRAIRPVAPDVLIVQLGSNELDTFIGECVKSGCRRGSGPSIGECCWNLAFMVEYHSYCHMPICLYRGPRNDMSRQFIIVTLSGSIGVHGQERLQYWNIKGMNHFLEQIRLDGVHLNDAGYWKYFRNIRGAAIAGISKLLA